MLDNEISNFMQDNSLSLELNCEEYLVWLESLSELDILSTFGNSIEEKHKISIYNECSVFSGTMPLVHFLFEYFIRHQEKDYTLQLMEENEQANNLVIVREHLAHMADPTDFVGYFQEISKISGEIEPCYSLRNRPNSVTSLMNIFLLRNPNQFRA